MLLQWFKDSKIKEKTWNDNLLTNNNKEQLQIKIGNQQTANLKSY